MDGILYEKKTDSDKLISGEVDSEHWYVKQCSCMMSKVMYGVQWSEVKIIRNVDQ